jgi:hypothetical protein
MRVANVHVTVASLVKIHTPCQSSLIDDHRCEGNLSDKLWTPFDHLRMCPISFPASAEWCLELSSMHFPGILPSTTSSHTIDDHRFHRSHRFASIDIIASSLRLSIINDNAILSMGYRGGYRWLWSILDLSIEKDPTLFNPTSEWWRDS